jgi:3-methyladenine DNA glycosylase/8-oxoguanine DNA glycosylase
MTRVATIALRGAGGEPVDLRRTLLSHGVAELPPMAVDGDGRGATVTLATADGPRTVRLTEAVPGAAPTAVPRATPWAVPGAALAAGTGLPAVTVETVDAGPPPSAAGAAAIAASVRRMLCLDDDLSGFYAACAGDPALAWARGGAGRLLRSPTVFEDVIKTVCTTNCAWSATERMDGALVGRLGEPAPGALPEGVAGRAFPTPEAMAAAGDDFYAGVARAGYRGASLRGIATMVAAEDVDLEALLASSRDELPDDEVERRLLALPGVGPYAAAHVMLLLGRHSRLVLDAWTRPKYARLQGKPKGRLVADRTIARRFHRYGDHAGLAFWLVLTRDWVDEAPDES